MSMEEKKIASEEYKEYDTVMIPLSTGEEKEFAIMDEFDLDGKHYIAVSLIQGDEILEGYYLYRAETENGELIPARIQDADELAAAADYFANR